LTNDQDYKRLSWKHKLNKHGEISRVDVAQTLVQSLEDKTAANAISKL
jgi:hypothetical protein